MKRFTPYLRYLIAMGALLLAVALIVMYVPFGAGASRAICRVKSRAAYALPLGRGDTLYLTLRADSLQNAATRPEVLSADSAEASGVFVSNAGHVATTDSLLLNSADSLSGPALRRRLVELDTLLAVRSRHARAELTELNYYASTHSVVDDGYNEVMAYREATRQRAGQADSARAFVRRALSVRHLSAHRAMRFYVRSVAGGRAVTRRASFCVQRDGLLLIQLDCARLPAGATRLSVYAFGTYAGCPHLLAFNDFGGLTATDSVWRFDSARAVLPVTEGGAWVNASGQLCGLQRGGVRTSAWRLAQLMRREHTWPVWWAVNVWKRVASLWQSDDQPAQSAKAQGARRASAATSQATPLQSPRAICVSIAQPDTTRYEGQAIRLRDGSWQRSGYGTLLRADGSRFEGLWRADTLVRGVHTDSLGVYRGTFAADLEAEGSGSFLSRTGDYYQGDWHKGRREGHGFSSRPGHMVRCGAWKADRFKGERMVYTADRVYGIDISRHQHEKDGRRYSINWSALRITSLGSGRRVKGAVDYPVSYVYIKATEGRSLYSRYYAADLRAARRRGIAVGSYHFWSPTSTGAQQAAYFLRMAWIADSDLPPVLDLEPTGEQIRQMGGRAAMFAQVLVWLRRVEQSCGKRPVLYVGQQFVNDHLLHAPAELRRYDVWIARYGQYKPYVHLLHWQLTPYGRVRGIHGEVDINVFNGTREQFNAYRQRNQR